MAGFQVGRRRGAQLDVHDAELAKRAGRALVAADERIHAVADELGFAEAELGSDAITHVSEALVAVRHDLHEAFRLNRLNHDVTPGSRAEVQARYARIVQLCERAENVLDEHTASLAERTARARRAPETIAGVRADAVRLRSRIPHARDAVERLAARYAPEALAQVEADPAQAEQLLAFAEHSASVAERRREAGQREQANVALEASVESLRRAATLLEAVETFEVEALRAESALVALVEESRRTLAAALEEPRSRRIADTIGELRAALAALPPTGVNTDPFAHLNRLHEARAALDAAVTAARERALDLVPLMGHVHHAINHGDRQLDIARDTIAGHQGSIGPEARVRLAEAERIRVDLAHYLGSAATITATNRDHRERAIALAQRVASLATEALQLARQDIEASRLQGAWRWRPATARS